MRQRRFIRLLRLSASHDFHRGLDAVAFDAGIAPIRLRNRQPDLLRDIGETQRQAFACRSLT
jgi:hypothetical protein